MSTLAQYEHVKRFTQGGGGLTTLVRHNTTKELFVLKVMRNPMRNGEYVLPQEVRALAEILRYPTHPNIGRIISQNRLEKVTHLFLAYYNGGDLLDYSNALYAQDKRAPTPPIFLLHFTIQMANALAFLHHNLPCKSSHSVYPTHPTLLHADIKLENVFLEHSDVHGAGLPQILLGDFGCAMTDAESMGWAGTEGYEAPEVELYRKQRENLPVGERHNLEKVVTTKADIYSFGVCLWRLGTKAWRVVEDSDTIPSGRDMLFQINSAGLGVPEMADFVQTMKDCLGREPQDRPEAVQVWNEIPTFQEQLDRRIRAGEKMPEI